MVAALVGLCGLVVAVRSVGFENTFVREPGGATRVELALDDAQYHARRARYTFEHFPSVLAFDPYLNFPEGAWVPWPPLYDIALASAAVALGADRAGLEHVLAWAPVVLAVWTALAVFAVARRQGGPALALAAVAFFALLPVAAQYASLGDPDHHAAVSLVATLLLLGHTASLAAPAGSRAVRAWQALLVPVRLAMLLTWHGSILYVLLAESLGAIVAAGTDRRDLLGWQALGCSLAALFGASSLVLPHSAVGGTFSAIELSRLQPTTLLAFAGVAGGVRGWLAWGARRGLATSRGGRLLAVSLAGLVAGLGVAFLARESLAVALDYATKAEPFIGLNYETQPLWSDLALPFGLYGAAAWLLPLVPCAVLVAARRAPPGSGRRAAALYLAGWIAILTPLAVSNARYGSDLAPAFCVGLAVGMGLVVSGLETRWPRAAWPTRALAALTIPLFFWSSLVELAPLARRSLLVLQGYEVVVKRPGLGLGQSVHAFVNALRAATPETAGYDDPSVDPAYGILTPPTLGFIVNALGHRPTPAGNFGPYVGREGLRATNRFYLARDEDAGLEEARALRARFVITTDEGRAPATLLHRLHRGDGGATDVRSALGHFRLVTEAPARGVPLGALRGVAKPFVPAPYKLFEIVEGAVLVVSRQPPGSEVTAEVEIATPTGRTFPWRTRARTDAGGIARLRVPYATEATEATEATDAPSRARPTGLYRVQAGASRWSVGVGEQDVVAGRQVAVPAPRR